MKDQAQFQALSVATIFLIEDSVFPLFSESEQLIVVALQAGVLRVAVNPLDRVEGWNPRRC